MISGFCYPDGDPFADERIEEERFARAALTMILEPGDTAAADLIRRYGADSAEGIVTGAYDTPEGYEDAAARWASRPRSGIDPRAALASAAEHGGGFLIPSDEAWPAALEELDSPPIGLWYRGRIEHGIPGPDRCVLVDGSRDATGYGLSVAGDIAADLARRGATVVSGLAYGVQGQAHRAALAARDGQHQPTIAVTACGIDRVYPSGHAELAAAIDGHGLILTELAPGAYPSRSRFLARNRLMAALAGTVCVAEARHRSAALATARTARALGRTVHAAPGSIYSANSAGCHTLIQEGTATLLTTPADLTLS